MPTKKDLSLEEIQEIIFLRGVEPAASIRECFGIGTSRVYKIWKKAEKKSAAEEDRGLAAVLSAVELLQEKMDLLLLEGQEIHFEDVENLEEKVGEAQKDILSNIEEGSNALREKTERIVSAANAAKAAVYSLLEIVGIVSPLGFTVWLLSFLLGIHRHRSLQERSSHVFSHQRKRSCRSQWSRTNQRVAFERWNQRRRTGQSMAFER